MIDSKFKFKLTLQPHLIYVEDSKVVFLAVNEHLYKSSSVLLALDSLVKLHMVLNVSYNFESQHILEFVQKYFYLIDTSYDSNYKCVLSLLAELNVIDGGHQ